MTARLKMPLNWHFYYVTPLTVGFYLEQDTQHLGNQDGGELGHGVHFFP